jgi:hypothetical protein
MDLTDRRRANGVAPLVQPPWRKLGFGDRVGQHSSAPLAGQPTGSVHHRPSLVDARLPLTAPLHLAIPALEVVRGQRGNAASSDVVADVDVPEALVALRRVGTEVLPAVRPPGGECIVDRGRGAPGPWTLLGYHSRYGLLRSHQSGELSLGSTLRPVEGDAPMPDPALGVTADEDAQFPGGWSPIRSLSDAASHGASIRPRTPTYQIVGTRVGTHDARRRPAVKNCPEQGFFGWLVGPAGIEPATEGL